MIFNENIFIRNKVLRDDAIYNLSFRFRNINLNNVNDIYFAINIIAIIATTLFETFIVAFVLELVIVIIINVNVIVIVIIIVLFVIVSKKPVLKFITFDFDIKSCFIMNTPLDKS